MDTGHLNSKRCVHLILRREPLDLRVQRCRRFERQIAIEIVTR